MTDEPADVEPPAPVRWQAPDGGWHPPARPDGAGAPPGVEAEAPAATMPPTWSTALAPSGRGRRRWLPIVVGAGVLVAVGGLAVAIAGGSDDSMTLRGEFQLTDTENVLGTFDDCSGTGGYDDFGPGMNVVVRDREGRTIATTDTRSLDNEWFEFQTQDVSEDDTGDDGEASTEMTEEATSETMRELYEGLFDIFGCSVVFEVDVPREDFYAIEIGRRGELTYSFEELEEEEFFVSLSLG